MFGFRRPETDNVIKDIWIHRHHYEGLTLWVSRIHKGERNGNNTKIMGEQYEERQRGQQWDELSCRRSLTWMRWNHWCEWDHRGTKVGFSLSSVWRIWVQRRRYHIKDVITFETWAQNFTAHVSMLTMASILVRIALLRGKVWSETLGPRRAGGSRTVDVKNPCKFAENVQFIISKIVFCRENAKTKTEWRKWQGGREQTGER